MPWWIGIISIIIEIVKLLLKLREQPDSPALNTEFELLKTHYKKHKERVVLERFRDRLRQRCRDCGV